MFFYKPYYFEPQKGGDKAYALLRDALKDSEQGRHRQGGDQNAAISRWRKTGRIVRLCSS